MCRKLGKKNSNYVDRAKSYYRDENGKAMRDRLGRPQHRLYSSKILTEYCRLADKLWNQLERGGKSKLTSSKKRHADKLNSLRLNNSVRAPMYDENWDAKRRSNLSRNNVSDYGSMAYNICESLNS